MRQLAGRVLVPIVCVLIQFVTFSSGQLLPPSPLLAGIGSAFAVLAGVALLWRESRPLLVLAGTVVAFGAQVLLINAVIPAAVAVAVEVVARQADRADRRMKQTSIAAVVAAIVAVAAAVTVQGNGFLAALFAGLLLAATSLGMLRASRAAHAADLRRDLVQAERLRIARDLHDVVGHGVGGIAVLAGAARLAIRAGDYDEATRAVSTIEGAGRGVLTEVRWLVGLLREDYEIPSAADVPHLVGNARRSGMDVALHVEGDLSRAPADVGTVAYRIIQEALTNVLRHSGQVTAAVSVRATDVLEVQILDHGHSPAAAVVVEGNGIKGMRERATAVGGAVRAGPGPDSTEWTVLATLPIRARV